MCPKDLRHVHHANPNFKTSADTIQKKCKIPLKGFPDASVSPLDNRCRTLQGIRHVHRIQEIAKAIGAVSAPKKRRPGIFKAFVDIYYATTRCPVTDFIDLPACHYELVISEVVRRVS
jgi:hypothetical protein